MIELLKRKFCTIIKIPYQIINNFIIRPFISFRFDKTYNIDTRSSASINCDDKIALSHATYYQAVPIKYLEILFDLLQHDSPYTHFIDIGCGKGRACFYASQKYKQVTGIDFSKNLIANAQENLKSYSGTINGKIIFELRDASLYDLPNETSLIYLYNPFDEYVLRKFIKRNMGHFLNYKSRIAYINDVCHDFLIKCGFTREFKHNAERGISIYSLDKSRIY
ncbi:MAG: class I SAM-dependent methyltransferase [Gammaproteobacteria bacterium]|nr:class I SAM-dependent methyltransferase [Gammaproteobacteria bacterium]